MKLDFKWPLSGDVMQSINPFSWFIRSVGQFGLININVGRAGSQELEERITEEVASYGRQLGRLAEVIEVMLSRFDHPDLSDAQREAIAAFDRQMEEVRRLKFLVLGRLDPDLRQRSAPQIKAPPPRRP